MDTLSIIILSLGALTATVGGIMQLVAAFRQNIWWGVAALLVPFASLVFVVVHWVEGKRGFFTALAGSALMAAGATTSAPVRMAITAAAGGKAPSFAFALPGQAPAPAATPAPAKDLNTQIQEKRDHIEQVEAQFGQAGVELVAQFQALNARRNSLHANDAAAVAQFNTAAAAYQTLNAAQKQRQQDLAATHQALDDLLVERAKHAQTAAPATSAAPAAKRVVMYTTSTCPACRAAKEYFARKGVHYEEHDVNASPADRQEFQRLGGSGVPLILVGNEKMEGFSAQRLDQLL